MNVAVCGECLEAAMKTWNEQYSSIPIKKGTYIRVHLETDSEKEGTNNEFPWALVIEDSEPHSDVVAEIDNDIYIVNDEYAKGDKIVVTREDILSHFGPEESHIDAEKDMEKRIKTIHTH